MGEGVVISRVGGVGSTHLGEGVGGIIQAGISPYNGVEKVISLISIGTIIMMFYVIFQYFGMFIAHGSYFLPDRPTAGKILVKNPPFKESTDCCL